MWAALHILRDRNFALYFSGRCISFLGNAMAPVAIAFAVLDLTGSATDLGIVLAARTIPLVLCLVVAGVWADRLPRNLVIVGANCVAGASQATAAILLITGHAELWQLVVLEAINGTAFAFFHPADSAMVPLVVPHGHFQLANSMLRLGQTSSMIGGAALAGVVVAGAGPGWAVAVDASTFFVCAGLTGSMRGIAAAAHASHSFISDLAGGWHEFTAHRWLWAIVLQFSLMLAAYLGGFSALGPVVADREMDGASSWALIVAAQATGFLVGSILMVRLRAPRPMLVATLAVFGYALPIALLALRQPVLVVAAGAFVDGICHQIFSIYWFTALQENVEPDALSRVSAYDALGSLALAPIGLAAAGPLSDAIGTTATLWLSASIIVATTALTLLVPEVRSLRAGGRARAMAPTAVGE